MLQAIYGWRLTPWYTASLRSEHKVCWLLFTIDPGKQEKGGWVELIGCQVKFFNPRTILEFVHLPDSPLELFFLQSHIAIVFVWSVWSLEVEWKFWHHHSPLQLQKPFLGSRARCDGESRGAFSPQPGAQNHWEPLQTWMGQRVKQKFH